MEFWIDMGFAVLLRLLKNKIDNKKWFAAFWKLHDAIEVAFPPERREQLAEWSKP